VRHGIDELPKKIDLGSLHQARHHDGEANAHGHAEHADESLSNPGAHVSPRNAQQEIRCHAFSGNWA
jgi:hypothetical protein